MKKLVCLLVTLVMLLSMFAGCGAKTESSPAPEQGPTAPVEKEEAAAPAEKIKLVGMCWGSSEAIEKMTAEVLATNPELAEKYEISYVVGGQHDAEMASKIRLGLSANENVCDFCVLNYTQVPEFARAGALVDISDAVSVYNDTMTNAGKVLSTYKGETVAVPMEVKTKVWFYRQDIFEECGVDASAIKNVDDLIAAGLKIQETYPNAHIWNLGATPQPYQYYLTLSGNGASFFDEDGNYNIASDAGTIAMLEDYKKMVDAGVVANISDWTTDWENALADGTIVSQPCAGWLGADVFLPTYSGEANKGNWKVAAWPEIGGAVGGSDAGGSVLVVPAFSSNPEAAAEFIAYMGLSEKGSMCVAKSSSCPPQNTKALEDPSLFAGAEDAYFGTSLMQAQIDALDTLGIFNYSPNAGAEADIVVEYFTKAVYGEMSIEDALAAAEADLKTMIGNAFE